MFDPTDPTVTELTQRVARLEAVLAAPKAWQPDRHDAAQQALAAFYTTPSGQLRAPSGNRITGDILADLASGALPATACVNLVVQFLAQELNILVEDGIGGYDTVGDHRQPHSEHWRNNLSRLRVAS